MTRAALLHLLDSPASLSAAAVQDLEQLAQAFPYCQTAHLLLAKAAHDQGSMLAGQRLRRAATYAADRQLLRRLLEQPTSQPEEAALARASVSVNSLMGEGVASAISTDVDDAPAAPAGAVALPVVPAERVEAENQSVEAGAAEADLPDPETTAANVIEAIEIGTKELVEERGERTATQVEEETRLAEAAPDEPSSQLEADPVQETPDEVLSEPATAAADSSEESGAAFSASGEAESSGEELIAGQEAATAEAAAPTDEVQAASISLIRPPAEAGTARFEFGLTAPGLEAEFTSYQLSEPPGGESAVATVRQSELAEPGPAAFWGAPDLAYALGGGSRLGYALQAALPAEVKVADSASAGEPSGRTLPAAGEFFAPDALLLEHLASQPPPAPPASSPLELIDSFLRRAPQRRRGIVTLLTVPEQADLSMRSTRAESDLASESLARILAGQGKTERAIAVYERLMARQPEKSAYFAVQIELLRHPPTPSS